jgi:hypothetical protein
LASDPFFSILFNGDVRFYDVGETWEEGYSDYSDGDEDPDDDDTSDDEAETESADPADLLFRGPVVRAEELSWRGNRPRKIQSVI